MSRLLPLPAVDSTAASVGGSTPDIGLIYHYGQQMNEWKTTNQSQKKGKNVGVGFMLQRWRVTLSMLAKPMSGNFGERREK